MERRSWFGTFVGVLVIAILAFAGWRTFRGANAEACYACNRPLHAGSRTVALVNGRSRVFCCPACALSQHRQSGTPIQITQLTSFLTDQPISPESAFVVRGSDVNLCERHRPVIADDKQAAEQYYDRCSPSLMAFAQRSEAVEFARQHSGQPLAFREMAAAFVK